MRSKAENNLILNDALEESTERNRRAENQLKDNKPHRLKGTSTGRQHPLLQKKCIFHTPAGDGSIL